MTLEEYLERFVDENTQTANEDVGLLVSDEQAITLGLFFINGLAGYIQCVRDGRAMLRTRADSEVERTNQVIDEESTDQDDFIN